MDHLLNYRNLALGQLHTVQLESVDGVKQAPMSIRACQLGLESFKYASANRRAPSGRVDQW